MCIRDRGDADDRASGLYYEHGEKARVLNGGGFGPVDRDAAVRVSVHDLASCVLPGDDAGAVSYTHLLNAGASRTYDLVLRDDQTSALIPFQIVSLNGASLTTPAGTTAVGVRAAPTNAGGTVPCQGPATGSTPPVCATHLVMFPGARAEVWVTPQPHSATLLTRCV